jgi:aldehyde:ferredoxin oxidoreductase
MSVKKQEFASYEPRALQDVALTYATTNRGACHIRAEVHDISLWGIHWYEMLKQRNINRPLDPLVWEDKIWSTKEIQDWYASLIDSSGMCNFAVISADFPEEKVCALLATATGVNFGGYKEAAKIGERIWNVERLFNLKAGLTAKDDTLPPRMLKEPMPDGPAKGMVAQLDKMLPGYYQLRGWDEKGVPTLEKLQELGLA